MGKVRLCDDYSFIKAWLVRNIPYNFSIGLWRSLWVLYPCIWALCIIKLLLALAHGSTRVVFQVTNYVNIFQVSKSIQPLRRWVGTNIHSTTNFCIKNISVIGTYWSLSPYNTVSYITFVRTKWGLLRRT